MNAMHEFPPKAEVDGDLEQFIHRWAEAIVTNDVTKMEPFTTDNWILIDRPGVITRDAFHQVVQSGQLRHNSMTHEVLGIDQYGPIAVIRTHGRNTAEFQSRPIKADEWTTNLLVEGVGGWSCFLTQLTPAAQAEAEAVEE